MIDVTIQREEQLLSGLWTSSQSELRLLIIQRERERESSIAVLGKQDSFLDRSVALSGDQLRIRQSKQSIRQLICPSHAIIGFMANTIL